MNMILILILTGLVSLLQGAAWGFVLGCWGVIPALLCGMIIGIIGGRLATNL